VSSSLIVASKTSIPLRAAPIEPSWIIEGNPIAANSVISRSEDGSAQTIVWECTEGRFNWYYDSEETLHVLEGSVVIESDAMAPTRFGPGDVLFFRQGAHARWNVEKKIRKLAFCRTPAPPLLVYALKAAAKVKRLMPLTTGGERRGAIR
jgi:uncharacterized protein